MRWVTRSPRLWKKVIQTTLLVASILLLLHFNDLSDLVVGGSSGSGLMSRDREHLVVMKSLQETGPPCPDDVTLEHLVNLAKNATLLAKTPTCVRDSPTSSDSPVVVIMVTYQRSGSSFLGELLNQNPNAFYMFEPIDAIYSSVYGTGYGWNVPDHIMSNDDGSARYPAPDEVDAVGKAVQALMNCDFDQVPIQVLTHTYLRVFRGRLTRLHPYIDCLGGKKVIMVSYRCRRFIEKFCPLKYYPKASMDFCHAGITRGIDDQMKVPLALFDILTRNKLSYETVRYNFADYKQCLNEVRTVAKKCFPHIEPVCKSSAVRGLKSVRLSMEIAIQLLKYIPNLKIIHNIRDPRGITLSRMRANHGDMMSQSAGRDIVKEAKMLCATIARHIQLRRALEKVRPGSSIQVTYEDFASKPIETAKEVYRFLGADMPQGITDWLNVNALGQKNGKAKARNASAIAKAWENKISFSKAKQIDAYCRNLYDEVADRWGAR